MTQRLSNSQLSHEAAQQAAGMAAAIDRSNKPTFIVIISAIALIATGVYAAFGANSHLNARERLREQKVRSGELIGMLDEIERLESERIDLRAIYPVVLKFETRVRSVAESIDLSDPERPSNAPEAVFNVQPEAARSLTTNTKLERKDVKVAFQFVSISKVFELIDALERDQYLQRGYVDSIRFSPAVGGFNGELTYTLIQVK